MAFQPPTSGGTDMVGFWIKKYNDDQVVWETKCSASGTINDYMNYSVWLEPGNYYLKVSSYQGWAIGEMKLWYYDRKYLQYTRESLDFGKNWLDISDPERVDSYPVGPTIYPDYGAVLHFIPDYRPYPIGSITHKVWVSSGIYYSRGIIVDYSVTKITFPPLYRITPVISWGNEIKIVYNRSAGSPSIREDSSHNAYVAWHDTRGWVSVSGMPPRDVFFQKIPYNFAPVNGTQSVLSVTPVFQRPAISYSTTLEAPILIGPKDEAEVRSLRPTFQ